MPSIDIRLNLLTPLDFGAGLDFHRDHLSTQLSTHHLLNMDPSLEHPFSKHNLNPPYKKVLFEIFTFCLKYPSLCRYIWGRGHVLSNESNFPELH